jgi:hypothetical protein
MISFLTSLPLWLSGLLVVGLTTALAMAGPVLVRRHVTLERLTTNNEVAGFKFAAVGVLYAVLLAFAIIVVWERFGEAEADVTKEAGAAATLYRLSQGIGEEPGTTFRAALANYLKVTIADDWPAMERGHASRSARGALDAVYKALLTFNAPERRDTALVSPILHELDTITQARRARFAAAEGLVPGVIWPVLFGGAVTTIAYTFFFGTENLLLLRNGEPASAGANDGDADGYYFFGAVDGHRHRSAICRCGEGSSRCARRGPGGFRLDARRSLAARLSGQTCNA